MAWLTIRLDGALVQSMPGEDGAEQFQPTEGAVEAVQMLLGEGHKVSVVSDRFQPMPNDRKELLRQHLQEQLAGCGFPPELEIWAGSNIPAADIDIGSTNVTFDEDWGLALAQAEQMLLDKGLIGPGQGTASLDPSQQPQEVQEEAPPESPDSQPTE